MNFIHHPVYVLAVLCLLVMASLYAEKTKIGRQFGSALFVLLFTAIVSNLNLIPAASNSIDLYSAIFEYVAPISIFYLLLNVNLRSIKQAGFPMIGLFLLGSLATTLGVLLAWFLVAPEKVLGEDAKIIAGMLTGTYTGGSANFNAIALEYDFQEKGALYAGTIAVDNVVTVLWFLFTLSFPVFMNRFWKGKIEAKTSIPTYKGKDLKDEQLDLSSLQWLAFLGIAALYVADLVSGLFPQIPSILILTTIAIALAQHKFVAGLKGSHMLGWYLMLLFLAVIGAYCELNALWVLKDVGLTLFLFTSLSVLFHGILVLGIGALLYRDWQMIAIISQANVGGASTAIVLTETFDRKELGIPAILVGSLGLALGTYLGFFVVYLLLGI